MSGRAIVVTGANGLVGAAVCRELAARDLAVRAVVRRAGTAPDLPGVTEVVGDFHDPDVADEALDGARGVVTTVHPMGSDREVQHEVGVKGTRRLAERAVAAGVDRLVHVSTAAVYVRAPGVGDVDESASLVGDDGGDYAETKRDAEHALAEVDGITRVLVRPPAILGPGETSIWNTLRPAHWRDHPEDASTNPDKTLAWVHVDDLAQFLADVAVGAIATADDPDVGPVAGATTAVTVAAPDATWGDYLGAVCAALGVEPQWTDQDVWSGHLRADRAHRWGWQPRVHLRTALDEVAAGLEGAQTTGTPGA